jgi:putative ATP-binding cassette transporter
MSKVTSTRQATPASSPPIVEVVAETGDQIEPPPPELLESDPDLSPEETEQARKDYLLTRFWISAKGFWGKSGDRLAWMFSIGLVVLIVTNVGFQYGINVWNRAIFDAIEKRDSIAVVHLTAVFFPLAIGSVLLGVAQIFTRMGIQRRWRAWLTNSVVTRWLTNGRYYQLNLVGGDHQNPEYRIAEDLRVATDSPVDFAAGVTSAFLSATTFIVVLWTIGGALTVTVAGSAITIPGFLVIAAVLYAAIASGSIMTIGRGFVQVSEDKNQAEAEYRYTLTRVRENGESIALLGGEQEERDGIDKTFTRVLRQWARLAGQHMRTHAGVAGIQPDRAGGAVAIVRTEVSRRQHVARTGDAGGISLHHRAKRVRMAGRQLSAARRLERLRKANRVADDVARRAGARRARRRHRPYSSRRDRG